MTAPSWPALAATHAREYVTILAQGLGSTFTDTLTQPAAWQGLASLSSKRRFVPVEERAAYVTSWTTTAAAMVRQIMNG